MPAVADGCRRLHLECVVPQFFGRQQHPRVLHNVELDRHHGTAQHLDTERVVTLRTHQPPAFVNSHTVAIIAAAVARLIHIHHALGHADIVLTLHSRLAIEATVALGLLTVVAPYLADGCQHEVVGILGHHHHLAQLDSSRHEAYLQLLRLLVMYIDTL